MKTLTAIILLFIAFHPRSFTFGASQNINESGVVGYGNTKWGMSKKEVEEILIRDGKSIKEGANHYEIIVTEDPFGSVGQVTYSFTPISNKLAHVTITSMAITMGNLKPLPPGDVLAILREKYGEPTETKTKGGISLVQWHSNGSRITFMTVSEGTRFIGQHITYSNDELEKVYENEKKEFEETVAKKRREKIDKKKF